jgi:superoxide reductase
MAKKNEVYKCLKCGNVIEVIAGGPGELVCCGEAMKLMDEKNKEGAGEKHLPVIEEKDGGVVVKVGSVPHPMDADHWIQMIEVITKAGAVCKVLLNPGDKPEAFFKVAKSDVASAREFCNKHGLWKV